MGAAAPLADPNPNPLALDDDECALSERSASTTTAAVAQPQTMAGFIVGGAVLFPFRNKIINPHPTLDRLTRRALP